MYSKGGIEVITPIRDGKFSTENLGAKGCLELTIPIRGGKFKPEEFYEFIQYMGTISTFMNGLTSKWKSSMVFTDEVMRILKNAHTFESNKWCAYYDFDSESELSMGDLHEYLTLPELYNAIRDMNSYIAFYPIFTDASMDPGTICGVTAKIKVNV